MIRAALPALALLAGCATGAPPETSAAAPEAVRTEVLRDRDLWTAEFRLGRDSPVWIFARSSVTREGGQPWRPGSWTVLTPGVRLERLGRHDALVADRGTVPRTVRVRFTPSTADLAAEYDFALAFSDGSTALWSGHFHLLPVESAAAAAALPLDLNGIEFPAMEQKVTFRDRNGRVLHAGARYDAATLTGGKLYVLFGPAEPVVTEDIAAVIDPALPAWIRRELAAFTPAILARLTEALGPHPGPRPTVLVTWAGATPGVTSMGGSTLRGQIGMTFEGEGVATESRGVRDSARWFLAHEAAHFWLGQTVGYEFARDAWITEGGADLVAYRALAAMDPAYDPKPALQGLLDECVALAGSGIASAAERNQHRAYYGCGAMFGLVAEAASGRSFLAYAHDLIDANRPDGILTRAEWLDALTSASGDRALAAGIERMLDGPTDPAASLAALFEQAGVPHERAEDGGLRLR